MWSIEYYSLFYLAYIVIHYSTIFFIKEHFTSYNTHFLFQTCLLTYYSLLYNGYNQAYFWLPKAKNKSMALMKLKSQQNYWVPKWKIAKLFCGLFCQFLQNSFKKAKFIERCCKKWQNNPKNNSAIFHFCTQ